MLDLVRGIGYYINITTARLYRIAVTKKQMEVYKWEKRKRVL